MSTGKPSYMRLFSILPITLIVSVGLLIYLFPTFLVFIANPDHSDELGDNFLFIREGPNYQIVIPRFGGEYTDMVPCKVVNYYKNDGIFVVEQVHVAGCHRITAEVTGYATRFKDLIIGKRYFWHLVDDKILGPCEDENCEVVIDIGQRKRIE